MWFMSAVWCVLSTASAAEYAPSYETRDLFLKVRAPGESALAGMFWDAARKHRVQVWLEEADGTRQQVRRASKKLPLAAAKAGLLALDYEARGAEMDLAVDGLFVTVRWESRRELILSVGTSDGVAIPVIERPQTLVDRYGLGSFTSVDVAWTEPVLGLLALALESYGEDERAALEWWIWCWAGLMKMNCSQ